jgi:hypothetical protein
VKGVLASTRRSADDGDGAVAHNRYFHLSGHHGARLTYTQSIRGEKKKHRTLLIKIMSPFLFRAAERRLADLEELWTDEIISKVPWKTFIESMMRDWEHFVINVSNQVPLLVKQA